MNVMIGYEQPQFLFRLSFPKFTPLAQGVNIFEPTELCKWWAKFTILPLKIFLFLRFKIINFSYFPRPFVHLVKIELITLRWVKTSKGWGVSRERRKKFVVNRQLLRLVVTSPHPITPQRWHATHLVSCSHHYLIERLETLPINWHFDFVIHWIPSHVEHTSFGTLPIKGNMIADNLASKARFQSTDFDTTDNMLVRRLQRYGTSLLAFRDFLSSLLKDER
jgi:hypothetical protein